MPNKLPIERNTCGPKNVLHYRFKNDILDFERFLEPYTLTLNSFEIIDSIINVMVCHIIDRQSIVNVS